MILSVLYQTWPWNHHSSQRSSLGYILDPLVQWKVLLKSSLFTKLPSTLQKVIKSFNISEVKQPALAAYRIGPGLWWLIIMSNSNASAVNVLHHNYTSNKWNNIASYIASCIANNSNNNSQLHAVTAVSIPEQMLQKITDLQNTPEYIALMCHSSHSCMLGMQCGCLHYQQCSHPV